MKIKGFPRVVPDETFTSWLFRCSLNKGCGAMSQKMGETYCSLDTEMDYDFDFSNNDFFELCHHLQIAPSLISVYFKPATALLLNTRFRLSYCPLCLREDISSYGLPVWRKTWCYVSAPFCMRHQVLLVHLSDFLPFVKSWDAFANRKPILDPQHVYYPRARLWGGVPIALLGVDVGIKVQAWLSALRIPARYSRATNALPIGPLVVATEFLLQHFLHSTAPGNSGGLARMWFSYRRGRMLHRDRSWRACLKNGAGEATPYQRMMALLLLGYVFDVFSDTDLRRIRSACCFSGHSWIDLIDRFADIDGPYPRELYKYMCHVFTDDMLATFSGLRWFIDNVKNHVR